MINKVFEDRIKCWKATGFIYKEWFAESGNTYKLIVTVSQLLDTFSTVPDVKWMKEKEMIDFIDGVAKLIRFQHDRLVAEEAKKLTSSLFTNIKEIFTFEGLMEYLGDDIPKIHGVSGRTFNPYRRQTFTLVSNNSQKPQTQYKPQKPYKPYKPHNIAEMHPQFIYRMPRQRDLLPEKKIIRTGVLELIYEEFNGNVFQADTEDKFIRAINEPRIHGELIKPIKGKQTYMYYLIGQIAARINDYPKWDKYICNAMDYDYEAYYKKRSGNDLNGEFKNKVEGIMKKLT